MKNLMLVVVLFLSLLLAGCGGSDTENLGGNISDGGTGPVIDDPIVDDPVDTPTPVAAILLTSNASSINTNSTATITVAIFNASGQVIGSTREVTFSLSDPTLGSIPAFADVTGGSTFQLFNSRGTEGSVVITAKVENVTSTVAVEISDQTSAADIALVADPSTLVFGQTASVVATVTDSLGNPVPSGTRVDFKVGNTDFGTVLSSATTDSTGVAQADFTASNATGIATITATSGSVANSAQIEINAPDVASGSIEFSSAEPQVIVIEGAGGQETSEVKFLVKDSSGTPIISSKSVLLELSGPNGGEYLGNDPTATSLEVATVNGFATVILHSGTIPGTATVKATVLDSLGEPTDLTTSSGVIAIGGGIPSEGHFSLSADVLNIEGLYFDNITDNILALIADRYGNYNVLKGTTVSFYSECGAIDRAVALDENGMGSVSFRTQTPDPQDVDADRLGTPDGEGSCGPRCDEENFYISDFYDKFGIDITLTGNNPRDGLCSIVTVVDGEEEFTDKNASGGYDEGETFVDTYDDIHLDMDDDRIDIDQGQETDGFPYDSAFEDLVVDRNEDTFFDGNNGIWDNNKRITKRFNLLYTGQPTLSLSSSNITVVNGGSETVYFSLHDVNYNPPVSGSTINLSLSGAGTLLGTTEVEFDDTNSIGSPIFSFTVTDTDPPTVLGDKTAELEINTDWLGFASSTKYLVRIPADTVELTANPVTGDLAAKITDGKGNLRPDGTVVLLEVDDANIGTIESPVEVDDSGLATAKFKAGTTIGVATITATAGGGTDNTTISVTPDTVTMSANPTSVTAGEQSTISATFVDCFGNFRPVGTVINFSVDDAAVGSIDATATITGTDGTAEATFTSKAAGTATVTATLGASSETLEITVTAPAP